DQGGKAEVNPLLNTVARFLNMHGQTGLSNEQMNVVVILHGAGAKNALNEEAYRKKFGRDNPNADLLKALDRVGVDFYICGQSLYSRGFSPSDVAEPVELSLSAMTALVHFQGEGYQLINFN
ncbi:MAG: DsrE family protein, partial [Lutimonas sp.]